MTPRSPLRVERLDDRLAPAVTFRFDYSLDTAGFFDDPDARAALKRAADAVSVHLQDSLAAITPGGGNTWRAIFLNPVTSRTVRRDNLTIAADEVLVFVAGDNLRGRTLGATGVGTTDPRGSSAWVSTVRSRGQAPAPADFGPWGGMIAFDSAVRWDFGADDPDPDEFDFEGVAVHELTHMVGFGAGTPSFDRYATKGGFVGPNAAAVYGGPVPLDDGFRSDHWAEGVESDGREAALTPSVTDGVRRPLTTLDVAALRDVGWSPTPPPPTPPPPPPPPAPPPAPIGVGPVKVAVGAGEGGTPTVTRLDAGGRAVAAFEAFPAGFSGGVRVATADFDNDGVPDVAVGTGPGAATLVRVIGGADQRELFTLNPFEAAFTGGVFVAAGDIDGDGTADLVVTPDEGGGPRVRVFDGDGFVLLADFFGIEDPNFRGGARAAVGDVNDDGAGDVVVAAGFGGGPRVAGFDGRSVAANRPARVFGDFFAFEQGLRNGVYVAAGDLDGDGFAEVIAGGGPGGGPRVIAFGGRGLVESDRAVVRADFFAGNESDRGGVRVAVADLDGDGRADLVTGAGSGAGSATAGYPGRTVSAAGTPPAAFAFSVYPEFAGGVFVG